MEVSGQFDAATTLLPVPFRLEAELAPRGCLEAVKERKIQVLLVSGIANQLSCKVPSHPAREHRKGSHSGGYEEFWMRHVPFETSVDSQWTTQRYIHNIEIFILFLIVHSTYVFK
jgi:hypothetical protein